MEGFGSAEYMSYHYGSVEDGYVQNPSLEQRLKKKYWKTKQTVLTKLKREEDEHIVAGDADIDLKLEKAHHLQMSCQKFLQALGSCSYHTRALSDYELTLGEFLFSNGENDVTHAGDVMKQVGRAHDQNAKLRLRTMEPITRLQQEFVTFSNTAIGDLSESIKRFEKARVDYRAALLWMKDVSEKLHNPDAREQLAKFREVQATVKEAKKYFEKMKYNLIEKINMVAASRSNLLSHTLPQYQKEMLLYLDNAANELHKVLVVLRAQTQHQYKLKFLSDEGLEGDYPSPEIESKDIPPLAPEGQHDSDGSLFALLQSESRCTSVPAPAPTLSAHKDEMSSVVSDLLALDSKPLQDTTDHQHDLLTDEWDEYSAIDSNKQSDEPPQPVDTDDWTDDLVEADQPCTPRELSEEISELMAIEPKLPKSAGAEDNFDPLSLSSVSNDLEGISIDSKLLDHHQKDGNQPNTQLVPARQLLPSAVPPVFPSPVTQSASTYTFNNRAPGYKPMVGGSGSDDSDSQAPGQKWANLFAHLDPIANEKA